MLMGRNPMHREALVVDLWKRAASGRRADHRRRRRGALGPFWARAVGQPIHRLPGTYRESVPAYASSAVLPSATAYAEAGRRVQGSRLGSLQADPSADELAEDIKAREAVRNAADDFTIMLDLDLGL